MIPFCVFWHYHWQLLLTFCCVFLGFSGDKINFNLHTSRWKYHTLGAQTFQTRTYNIICIILCIETYSCEPTTEHQYEEPRRDLRLLPVRVPHHDLLARVRGKQKRTVRRMDDKSKSSKPGLSLLQNMCKRTSL
jgi:hypothetical protein